MVQVAPETSNKGKIWCAQNSIENILKKVLGFLMTELIHIIEVFETSIEKTLIVNNDHVYNVGDNVIDDSGKAYVIKKVALPTSPSDQNYVGLVVLDLR